MRILALIALAFVLWLFVGCKKIKIVSVKNMAQYSHAMLDLNGDKRIDVSDVFYYGMDMNNDGLNDIAYLHRLLSYREHRDKDGLTIDFTVNPMVWEIWYDRSFDGIFDWVVPNPGLNHREVIERILNLSPPDSTGPKSWKGYLKIGVNDEKVQSLWAGLSHRWLHRVQ